MHASIRELRLHTKEYLDVVGRGEEVIITYRGKNYAKLIAITNPESTNKNLAFGLWSDNSSITDVDKFVDQLRETRNVSD